MESTLIGVVMASIGQLTIVDVVLSTSVSLDNANDAEKKDEEGKGEDHSDEPASSNDAVMSLRHDDDFYNCNLHLFLV
jgi:hypothetical protein